MPGTTQNGPSPDDFFPENDKNWLDKDLGKFSTKNFVKKSDNEIRKITIDRAVQETFKMIALAFGAVDFPPEELFDKWYNGIKADYIIPLPATKICTWTACKKHKPEISYLSDELTIHVPEKVVSVCRKENSKTDTDEITVNLARHSMVYLDEKIGNYLHHQNNYKVFEPRRKLTNEDYEASTLTAFVGRLSQLVHDRMPAFFGEEQALPEGFGKEHQELLEYSKRIEHLTKGECPQRVKLDKKTDLVRFGIGYALGNIIYSKSKNLQSRDMFFYRGEGSWQGVLRAVLPAKSLLEAEVLLGKAAEKPAPKGISDASWEEGQKFYREASGYFGLAQYLAKKRKINK